MIFICVDMIPISFLMFRGSVYPDIIYKSDCGFLKEEVFS